MPRPATTSADLAPSTADRRPPGSDNARLGVRAQIQHLRAYADASVTEDGFAYELVDPRFDDLAGRYGSVTTWSGMGGGNWASDPYYASKVTSLYRDLLATSLGVPSSCDNAGAYFSDVFGGPTGNAINCVAYLQVASGMSPNVYGPDAPVTRGQMATFLVRSGSLGGIDFDSFTEPKADPFVDDDGTTHEPQITKVAIAGIASGTGDQTFDPTRPVTRGQMATFLVRTAEHMGISIPDATDAAYFDAVLSVHRTQINRATQIGLVSGYPDGSYRPQAQVTRAQMALFLNRLLVIHELQTS